MKEILNSRAAPPFPAALRTRMFRRAMHLYWRFARPMTLGVRAALIHPERGVFLIEHTYTPGWHMPGGGVEAGETILEAMAREIAEEGNIVLEGEPELHGLFHNVRMSPRDHVAVFVCRAFRQTAPKIPDREIRASGFFPLDALPEGTTRATRARLVEIAGEAPRSPLW